MKITIPPAFEGYTVRRTAEVVHIALEGGLGRTRRDIIDATRRVNVKWRVSVAGYEYLQKAHRYFVANGTEEFTIDLIVDTAALVEHTCKFVPGTFGLEAVEGLRYIVRAQLDVLPVPYTVWPGSAPDTPPLWLDTYTGVAGTLLENHAQDIPWNGSVWLEEGSEDPTVELDGDGNAVMTTPRGSGPGITRTDFNDGPITLEWGYRLEVDFAIRRPQGPGGEGAGSDSFATFYRAEEGSGQITFSFYRAQADTEDGEIVYPPSVGVEFYNDVGGYQTVYIDLADDGATHRISATVNAEDIVIALDGVVQATFTDVGEGDPLYAFNTISRYEHGIEGTPGESEFIEPTDAISRSAIYGEVLPSGGPFLFFNDGSVPAPYFSEFGSAIDISALTPIPWELGVNVVNSDGSGNNESYTGDIVIPLYSNSGLPGFGEYSWEPATLTPPDSGDPENPAPPWPVPSLNGHNPYPELWPNATHFLYLNYEAFAITLADWPGGVFTLYSDNDPDGDATVITFLPNALFYPPVRVEYGYPA